MSKIVCKLPRSETVSTYKPVFELIPMFEDDKDKKPNENIELRYEEIGPLKPEQ